MDVRSSPIRIPGQVPDNWPAMDFNGNSSGIGVNEDPGTSVPVEPSADVMAVKRHHFELSSIHQSEHEFTTGSVLAIVQFPQDPGVDCNGCRFKPVYKLRVNYDKLIATGSAKIQAMLSPRRQERIRRRHGLQELPDGVEFVIDLTPPSEGPELADLIAALWLPAGVKLWYLAGLYSPYVLADEGLGSVQYRSRRPFADRAVGAVLALGHDDNCCCVQDHDSDGFASPNQRGVSGITAANHLSRFRQIKDYCGIRHRVNIIRLLRAINGADLLINSASRMWTLVHIAIDLEITSVVRDSVAQWFLAAPNTKFMEIFPEESFKVALALQIPDVLVTSFKVLVNEFAIDHAATSPNPQRPQRSWAQRRRGDYGDMPMDPVEHAGIAFYERIRGKLDKLRAETALDDLDIFEWERLKLLGGVIERAMNGLNGVQPVDAGSRVRLLHNLHQKLVKRLQQGFQDHVKNALAPMPPAGTALSNFVNNQRRHYIPEDELIDMEYLQKKLNDYQRALCPFFWESLRSDFQGSRSKVVDGTTLNNLAIEFNQVITSALTLEAHSFKDTCLERSFNQPHMVRFDLTNFLSTVSGKLKKISLEITGTDSENELHGPPMLISDHMIRKLDENELKFLPIWAGGWDDGSGGVFQEAIPSTEMGPSEPGPAYHTGWTVAAETDAATVTQAPSISDLALTDLELSDAPRSLDVQDSVSATTPTGRQRAPWSETSEQFNADDHEFVDAMIHEPAEHQTLGQVLVNYVDGHHDIESRTVSAGTSVVMASEADEDEDMMLSDDTLSVGSAEGNLSDFELV